jgi:peptide/nickel transport system permease protein
LVKFFVRRISFAALVLLLISIFVFSLSRASGDPRNLYLDEYATDEMYEAWGIKLGLDKPLYIQYLTWLRDVMRADFGESLYHNREPYDLIKERLPATVSLAAIAFCWAILVGVPLGVLSAVKRGTFVDYFARGFALLGQAMPVFWVALMSILIFSVELGWLPTSRKSGLDSYIMPALCLGWLPAAALLRITRGSMLEILDGEFIKLARAKGVSPIGVIWKHAFRNALIAPVTMAAIIIASFLTGTVVIEAVFAWPGLGGLSIDAIKNNDFPMMSAIILLFGVFYLAANMLVDLLYMVLDPRVRVE